MSIAHFDFHGIPLEVRTLSPDLLSNLTEEFFYFKTETPNPHAFLLEEKSEPVPSHWRPSPLRTSKSTVFWSWSSRRVRLFHDHLISYDFWNKRAEVWSLTPDHRFEVFMLLILSYVGERLDMEGWHRIHGFGFDNAGRGSVVLAPSGGGKSTLALEVLRETGARIYSDDTPLVNAKGEIRSFPQRIALHKPHGRDWKTFTRFGHCQKFVLGSRYFADRIVDSGSVERFILLNESGRIGRFRFAGKLLRWLVVGHETPQIWEFYLRVRPRDLWQKSKILLSRLRVAYRLWSRSTCEGLPRQSPARMADRLLFSWGSKQGVS